MYTWRSPRAHTAWRGRDRIARRPHAPVVVAAMLLLLRRCFCCGGDVVVMAAMLLLSGCTYRGRSSGGDRAVRHCHLDNNMSTRLPPVMTHQRDAVTIRHSAQPARATLRHARCVISLNAMRGMARPGIGTAACPFLCPLPKLNSVIISIRLHARSAHLATCHSRGRSAATCHSRSRRRRGGGIGQWRSYGELGVRSAGGLQHLPWRGGVGFRMHLL